MTNETRRWTGKHDAAALASRVRKILAGRRGITEKQMFGGTCFLRRSHMLCGAAKQGFMFRVGKAQHARAVARRGASPVVMRGRDLEGFDQEEFAMNFPNETKQYRAARSKLLNAEIALRKQIEAVAAQRRKLPPGGEVPEDYAFIGTDGEIRLSQLFTNGSTLVAYSFMYGPKMAKPCPMCTSMLDGLNGNAQHVAQRTNLVVVARSPLPRILEHARSRGWSNLKLLSSEKNTYNRDYHGEDEKGGQWPMLNVFHREGSKIRHTWGSEVMAAKEEPGQNARHVDAIWPLWNLLDFTPEGRGSDWYPKLSY